MSMLVQNKMISTAVNGVVIEHFADPRAAPDGSAEQVMSAILLWLRGLEMRSCETERALNVERALLDQIVVMAERGEVPKAAELAMMRAAIASTLDQPVPTGAPSGS